MNAMVHFTPLLADTFFPPPPIGGFTTHSFSTQIKNLKNVHVKMLGGPHNGRKEKSTSHVSASCCSSSKSRRLQMVSPNPQEAEGRYSLKHPLAISTGPSN